MIRSITVQPGFGEWQPTPRPTSGPQPPLIVGDQIIEAPTRRAGFSPRISPSTPLSTQDLKSETTWIATGHQATLWHPGILAKDLAIDAFARQHDARTFHLVVDHDAHEALQLTVPLQQGDTLATRTVQLADHRADVPTGMQPPANAEAVVKRLDELQKETAADLQPLAEAWQSTGETEHGTLARQITAVLSQLRSRIDVALPILYGTDLHGFADFWSFVRDMVNDAPTCVKAYNNATHAHPAAGIAPLTVEPMRIELPLWLLRWNQPRQRVYADLTDATPLLTDEAGNEIHERAWLEKDGYQVAPRALSLTAFIRMHLAGLFVHGKGGGIYDAVMEHWINDWLGKPLAPMAVVSADVTLPFDDVPLAEPADVRRAVWHRHHLPHNIDRAADVDPQVAARKQSILQQMPGETNRYRKADLFHELHTINRTLADQHADLIANADAELARTRAGVQNAAVAVKRDWCIGLYPQQTLLDLKAAFTSMVS